MSSTTPRVLMVCLGNICRSPMAEGILRNKAEQLGVDLSIDSAGTSNWHQGEKPDERAIEEMAVQGIDISKQRSRPFVFNDFQDFDYILVMDTSNRSNVLSLAKTDADREKVKLILDFGNEVKGVSVPDPYYDDSFNHVFELLDYACNHFIKGLK